MYGSRSRYSPAHPTSGRIRTLPVGRIESIVRYSCRDEGRRSGESRWDWMTTIMTIPFVRRPAKWPHRLRVQRMEFPRFPLRFLCFLLLFSHKATKATKNQGMGRVSVSLPKRASSFTSEHELDEPLLRLPAEFGQGPLRPFQFVLAFFE